MIPDNDKYHLFHDVMVLNVFAEKVVKYFPFIQYNTPSVYRSHTRRLPAIVRIRGKFYKRKPGVFLGDEQPGIRFQKNPFYYQPFWGQKLYVFVQLLQKYVRVKR